MSKIDGRKIEQWRTLIVTAPEDMQSTALRKVANQLAREASDGSKHAYNGLLLLVDAIWDSFDSTPPKD